MKKTNYQIILIFFLNSILAQTNIKELKESPEYWNTFWENLESSKNNFGVSSQKTIAFGNKALLLAEQGNDSLNSSIAKLYIAAGYEYEGNFQKALNYYINALDVFRKLGRTYDEAYVYDCIGLIYYGFGDGKKALIYFEQANAIYVKLNQQKKQSLILNHMGMAYQLLENNFLARECYEKAIAICLDIKNYKLLSALYQNLGQIYLSENNFSETEILYNLSMELYNGPVESAPQANLFINFAYLYIKSGELEKVPEYLEKAEKIVFKSGSNIYLSDIYYNYHLYYDKISKPSESLKYLKLFNDVKNQIKSSRQRGVLDDILTSYALKNRDKKISQLEVDKASFWKKLEKFRVIGVVLLVLLLTLIGIIYFLNLKLSFLKMPSISNSKDQIMKAISKKYQKSNLNEETYKQIEAKINELIENEKIFRVKGITINEFAKKAQISRTYVSQVINEKFNMSFSNFINGYRIQEAVEIIESGNYKNYTIESIAEEVGFNSTNVFTKNFKKTTGKYPSEYQKMH